MSLYKHNLWAMPLSLALVACGGGGGGSDNSIDDKPDGGSGGGSGAVEYQQQVVDARNGYTYLNLTTGETVAADAEWHMAFSRSNIQLNGGASGNGKVAGALAVAQDDFYTGAGVADPNVFMNATADAELEHLADSFPAPANWQTDTLTTAFGSDWYNYDFTTHTITPNPDLGWLVRSGEGDSYARVRVTGLDYGADPITYQIDLTVQAADTSQLTTSRSFTGSVPKEGGEACYDFDAGQTVACTGTAWDIKLNLKPRALSLVSNSGPNGDGNGAVLGPIPWTEVSTYASATIDSNGTSMTRAYAPDQAAGVFSEHSWYAYNLGGAHKLWPNYRVYLVDTNIDDDASPVYAVQIINYYGEDGASGQPVVRWKQVSLTGGAN